MHSAFSHFYQKMCPSVSLSVLQTQVQFLSNVIFTLNFNKIGGTWKYTFEKWIKDNVFESHLMYSDKYSKMYTFNEENMYRIMNYSLSIIAEIFRSDLLYMFFQYSDQICCTCFLHWKYTFSKSKTGSLANQLSVSLLTFFSL